MNRKVLSMSKIQSPSLDNSQHIKNIVIVGGGSAGWMTAAMLAKQLGQRVSITLVESDEIGTIGVGEATIPPIKNFNRILGIDETEFLSFCNGSIKLAIEFENWTRIGHKYMHPFGSFAADFDYMSFPYYWLKANAEGYQRNLEEFSYAWHLASNNKFHPPSLDRNSLASTFDYAFHFDASQYALFLRNYSEGLGVKRIEGKVSNVQLCPHSGNISKLELEQNSEHSGCDVLSADFFIDCSGQRALLLGDALGVGFESWQHYLLNDRAVAVQTAHMKTLSPYTRSIAHHAGWQWRIPLQTRMGNGNVYSSQYMSEQEAEALLLSSVEGPTLTEPKHIKFKTGRRQQFWQKNCVAIGLSAGFLEPLESTSLHLIQSGIMRLVRLFPDMSMSETLQQEYNNSTVKEYEAIRDFIILHYNATERDDSEYWRHCSNIDIPESLKSRIALYKEHGHLMIHDKELFKHENWMAVLAGQNVLPQSVGPVMASRNALDLNKTLESIYNNMKQTATSAVSHEMYLMKNCPFKA